MPPIAAITDTQGLIAIAAAALAAISLICCGYLLIRQRKILRAQRVLLGQSGQRDLAEHALGLQEAFHQLREYVEEASAHVQQRVESAEQALQGAVTHRSLVRYDAYNEHSGRQSLSIALLDARRSGIILTCIHHRDQARVYAKLIHDGEGEIELSPEEQEALLSALSGSDATAAAGG